MNNKLIPLIMTLVVGIILAGSLLTPVVNDAQNTTSDKVVLKNNTTATYIVETTDYKYEVTTDSETINGESKTVGAYTQVITTDKGVLYKLGAATFTLFLPTENVKVKIDLGTSTPSITATIENNTFTVAYGTNEYTLDITTAYAYTGDGNYYESSAWPTFITNKPARNIFRNNFNIIYSY